MAITIFLCGHGSWKPDDGYFQLPKGCSMTFVVHHAKLLPTDDMYRVCGGTYPNEPDRTIGEFQSCPNMTWTSDEEFKMIECAKRLGRNNRVGDAVNFFPNDFPGMLNGTDSMTLGQFFAGWANPLRILERQHDGIRFVWNCCSHMDLRPSAKGAEIGINAGQMQDRYVHLNLVNGIAPTGKESAL